MWQIIKKSIDSDFASTNTLLFKTSHIEPPCQYTLWKCNIYSGMGLSMEIFLIQTQVCIGVLIATEMDTNAALHL